MLFLKSVFFILFIIQLIHSFEIGLVAITGVLSGAFISSINYLYCKYSECCTPAWIVNDINGLQLTLHQKLFGQPLVAKIIGENIQKYINDEKEIKPLIFSFNGGPGTGKTYAAKLIAEFLYKNGLKSNYIHHYIASKDFKNTDNIEKYKKMIAQSIVINETKCSQLLYIFDEVDLMPKGLMQSIIYLIKKNKYDLYWEMKGVPLKIIVIMLSNSGTHKIDEWMSNNNIKGNNRESLTPTDVAKYFTKTDILKNGDDYHVDFFVPFLPLEKEHIKLCIQEEFKRKNQHYGYNLMNNVIKLIDWYQFGDELYSTSGCKHVHAKIGQIL